MRSEKQLERTQRRRVRSACPVKQRRALLKSNPPRDNWIEGDEIKSVSTLGEPKSSPRVNLETFISEPCHALKNLGAPGANRSKKLTKNSLSECPFFRSKHKVIVPLARFVMDLHREAQTISFGITLSIAAVRDLGEADFGEQP